MAKRSKASAMMQRLIERLPVGFRRSITNTPLSVHHSVALCTTLVNKKQNDNVPRPLHTYDLSDSDYLASDESEIDIPEVVMTDEETDGLKVGGKDINNENQSMKEVNVKEKADGKAKEKADEKAKEKGDEKAKEKVAEKEEVKPEEKKREKNKGIGKKSKPKPENTENKNKNQDNNDGVE